MIKIPQTIYPVLDVIKQRWSARSFSEKAITETEMMTLLEAASWASSSMNEQPWSYIYAHKGTVEFEKIGECLAGGNQPWAKNAAVLVLSVVNTHFASNGQENIHAWYDVGSANILLLLQAASMAIYGHEMGGFSREKVQTLFPLPANKDYTCILALGYLDAAEKLIEPFKTRELTPRSRKPLGDIILNKYS
jgi:nitroreductase